MAFDLSTLSDFLDSDKFAVGKNTLTTAFGVFNNQRASSRSAESLRSAGSAAVAAANYNNAIDRLDTSRRTQLNIRQTDRLIGSQRAMAGGSGFSSNSKSNLAMANAALTMSERANRQEITSLTHRQQQETYQAQLRKHEFDVKAAAVSRQGSSDLFGGLGKLAGSAGSLLSLLGS